MIHFQKDIVPPVLLMVLLTILLCTNSPARTEPFWDRLPFQVGGSIGTYSPRTGRLGRPLRPIESMDTNNREIWDKHPYHGTKLIITFPF